MVGMKCNVRKSAHVCSNGFAILIEVKHATMIKNVEGKQNGIVQVYESVME